MTIFKDKGTKVPFKGTKERYIIKYKIKITCMYGK